MARRWYDCGAQEELGYAFLLGVKSFEKASIEAGGGGKACKISSTCATDFIPTSATLMPGADLTNCTARCASVVSPSNACDMIGGNPRASRPCISAALAHTA